MGNTVLFITGDNGTSGYGKGQTDMEKGPRVPLVVYGPRHVKPIGRSDALTNHCDIFATLRDMAGATLPKENVIDGHSFAPLLAGRPFKEREWIFSYYLFKRMLRDKRWLLDGKGRLYDCGVRRDEKGYKDVTDSTDPEVLAVKGRFARILAKLPEPDPKDPVVAGYRKKAGKKGGSGKEIVPDKTTLTVGAEPVTILCRAFGTLHPAATARLSHDGASLAVDVAVTTSAVTEPPGGKNVWGETDGVEVSLYAGGIGNLITYVYPDGSSEFSRNVKGSQKPQAVAPGKVSATASRMATGWQARIRFYAALFGGKLPKSAKLNVGGYRSSAKPPWFAWINKGRENFRPKNQGVIELK